MKSKNCIGFALFISFFLSVTLLTSCDLGENENQDNIVADLDGNVYTTVKIGSQVWMKENLKTTRYSNGDLIGTTTPPTLDITGESAPKYQWAYDGNESNVAVYGRLYTWYAVTDSRKVCPAGWHVPTDADWHALVLYLDPTAKMQLAESEIAGAKLKEAGTSHWISPNLGATNESGFTALPGGSRYFDLKFANLGSFAMFWSSEGNSSSMAIYRRIGTEYINISRCAEELGGANKTRGNSVRCLKD
jgi:uncharacterized protein (TIGR02145 family)